MQLRRPLVYAVPCVALACGAHPSSFTNPPGQDASADVAAPPTGDAGFGNTDSGPTQPTVNCSSDLHDVLDGQGNVVATCPPDQGCGPNGTCVPACDSATANKSTIGCEYYSVDPDIIKEGLGACYAAYIANTWDAPITINVERGGVSYNPTTFARVPSGTGLNLTYAPLPNGQLAPGQVAILFLSHLAPSDPLADIPCPTGITPALSDDAAIHGTGTGQAFHITTSAPAVAYDILPYGGGNAAATSATLLLPTSVWDTNYLAINAFPPSVIAAQYGAMPSLDIVAQEDGTQVTIKPTANIVAGTNVAAASAGVPHTYNLDKGQVLQFSQTDELSGSPIQSNKPIALWGGANGLNIDPSTCCADSAHQQIPPVMALGSEYVAVKYRNRDSTIDETVPWRVMGFVDGTQLTYDPSAPPNAPTTINSGDVVEIDTTMNFVVRSQDAQHPFYMSGHMSGCETYFSASDCRGDAEFVNVVPAKQFLSSYTFFTDPTYPETNLVVVRSAQNGSFYDVTLDCAGTLTGWQPVGSSGAYEFTRVDLSRHNFMPQGSCDNGRHQMSSSGPFGVTVWGWGSAETQGAYHLPQAPGFYSQAVSYAYPAGMGVRSINNVVVLPK